MTDAAIIVLAGTEAKSDLGRVANALQTVQEFDNDEDSVELIFDGAGTQWIPELEDEDHDYHSLYASVEEHAQACEYCANAYEVDDEIEDEGVPLSGESDGHPSVRSLVSDGYEVITY